MSGWLLMVRRVSRGCGEKILTVLSRRLLQPDQSALWIYYGVLLATILPGDESYR